MATYMRYARQKVVTALTDTPVVFVMGSSQSGKTTLVQSLMDADRRPGHFRQSI